MRKPGQDRTNYGAGHEGRDSIKVKKDDVQVTMEIIEKHWAEKPGIYIEWMAM